MRAVFPSTRPRLRRGLLALSLALLLLPPALALAQGQLTTTPLPASQVMPSGQLSDWTFRQLGIDYPITLRGVSGSIGIPFSVRSDRLVSHASLHLNYSYSPALIPELSHLKVSVNDVVVATVPLPAAGAGKPQSTDIPIDPKLIADYNRLNLQLIGHYTRDCEDPDHSSLWANIDGGSVLSLTTNVLPLANDLGALPLPFFDRRDIRKLELPFVFAAMPDTAQMQSAGIVASWFGALAGYRGASFPVSLGSLPLQSNAVVLATPAQVPAGITLPPIDGPTLAMVERPGDADHKLLLVLGRNDQELRVAATALALGTPLDGAVAVVRDLQPVTPRKPYDAPNWVPSDRPVRLGSLAGQNALNVSGFHPDLVRINLQLPPDLFGWHSKGIPLDLDYRYTPPPAPGKSLLSVDVNQAFVAALPLYPAPDKASLLANWLPRLASDGSLGAHQRLHLPVDLFSANSQLRFSFYFQRPPTQACQVTLDDQDVHGAIGANSTIDLSGIPHYLAMPDLAAFANAGFPFSRMADLSQSALVLPDTMGAGDLGNALDVLGHIAASTGFPALNVAWVHAGEVTRYADRDLLVLGSPANQPLLRQWADRLPIGDGARTRYPLTDWLLRALPGPDDEGRRTDLPTTAEVSVQPVGGDVLVMGLQSPLQAGRSVVIVQANEAADVGALFKAWQTPAMLKQIQGSVALIHGEQVRSLSGNQQYYVGQLPWLTKLRWLLTRHPLLLALAALAWCIVLAYLARWVLKRVAAARRKDEA